MLPWNQHAKHPNLTLTITVSYVLSNKISKTHSNCNISKCGKNSAILKLHEALCTDRESKTLAWIFLSCTCMVQLEQNWNWIVMMNDDPAGGMHGTWKTITMSPCISCSTRVGNKDHVVISWDWTGSAKHVWRIQFTSQTNPLTQNENPVWAKQIHDSSEFESDRNHGNWNDSNKI